MSDALENESQKSKSSSKWVLVNAANISEEALTNSSEYLGLSKETNTKECDTESDGISVISESSHIHDSESNNEIEIDESQYSPLKDDESGSNFKWNLVAFPTAEANKEHHQFYLNCLDESVQELSENELDSFHCKGSTDGQTERTNSTEINSEPIRSCTENDTFSNIRAYCISNVVVLAVVVVISSTILAYCFGTKNNVRIKEKLNEKKQSYLDALSNPVKFCDQIYVIDDLYKKAHMRKCLKQIVSASTQNLISQMRSSSSDSRNSSDASQDCRKQRMELQIKEQYLMLKEQFLIQKEYEIIKAELAMLKKKKHKFKKQDPVRKSCGTKDNKVRKRTLKNNDEAMSDHLVHKEDNIQAEKYTRKEHGEKKFNHKPKKQKSKQNGHIIAEENETMGMWYTTYDKVRRGRYNARKKNHMGDWYFERANDRKWRRNKLIDLYF